MLCGSLRSWSTTRQLLDAALGPLSDDVRIIRPGYVRTLPMYDADLDSDRPPVVVEAARSHVRSTDGIVIATPEYNDGLPGGLKNWLDWVSRPKRTNVLIDRPVAVLGASANAKGARATVTWLRHVLGVLGARVVGDAVAVPNVGEALQPDGTLIPAAATDVAALIDALLEEARKQEHAP